MFPIFVLCAILAPFVCYASIGAEWNPTGDPIGGGPGYSDSVRHQDADVVVYNKSQLKSALSSATAGDVIYVMDTVQINLKGEGIIVVKPGVTLASGRGRVLGDTISWGALIYDDSMYYPSNRYELFQAKSHARITGLRLRGFYDELEGGRDGLDSCGIWTMWGVHLADHGAEIDNCEIWGFRRAVYNQGTDYDTVYVHHNYFHEGCINDVYHVLIGNQNTRRRGIIEANYFDHSRSPVMGEGTGAYYPSFEARYNITGEHGVYNALDQHGSDENNPPSPCGGDWIHHNTVKGNYYATCPLGVWVRGIPTDSFWVNDNWFYAPDSAEALGFGFGGDGTNSRFWNNYYAETPQAEVIPRIPTANISISVDSGSAPLSVTFKATGSSGGSGGYGLRSFYWRFGDNYHARFADIDDSVTHTYNDIGLYKAELMVVNDLGVVDKEYVDINVVPADGRNYLSFWARDNENYASTGYFVKQCLVNGNVLWSEDVAGYEGWEHIILDLTDSIAGMDSVEIAFRLYCTQYNSGFLNQKLRFTVDDVHLHGGNVVNGDFESGVWSGYQQNTTDGYWVGSNNGNREYCYDCAMYVNSGERAFWMQAYEGTHSTGAFSQVKQTVAIGAHGIPHGNSEIEPCSLYCPYPNPAKIGSSISYVLSAANDVSMNIYDACGRLVRSLVTQKQSPGEYTVLWNGTDIQGRAVASGIYFCNFVAGDFKETRQLVWLK
ncbi:MAG: T9SS type A sorting domain-containing protein [candidate division WOR-3 bacterium]|nr:MAG: T9SS type A sorting domain-containing protein [candidate division WOR-3 bacterium]